MASLVAALSLLALAGSCPRLALAVADVTPAGGIASHVRELDGDTFDATVGKGRAAVVLFYAPWCGHCRQMVPDFKKAATALKGRGVRTAAVNSDNAPGLARQLGIRGFPTVRWVGNGKSVDHKGARTYMGAT